MHSHHYKTNTTAKNLIEFRDPSHKKKSSFKSVKFEANERPNINRKDFFFLNRSRNTSKIVDGNYETILRKFPIRSLDGIDDLDLQLTRRIVSTRNSILFEKKTSYCRTNLKRVFGSRISAHISVSGFHVTMRRQQ